MKVAVYVRISTKKQETLNQEIQLKKYCEKNNWKIYNIYQDIISGKETTRPKFNQMYRDAHKKLFEMVLFWDLSRFSRAGTYHTLMKLKELENLEIQWHSYNEPYVSSIGQFKDVVISVLSSVAKAEREKISDRTKAGLERAKKQGKKLGKVKRILTPNEKKIIINEYKKQGSINKTAKVFKGRFSYGFIYNFLSQEGGIKN